MIATRPAVHMYANPLVQFRDPFASTKYSSRLDHPPVNPYLDFYRALTPPPDMNGAHPAPATGYHPRIQTTRNGEHVYPNYASRDPAGALYNAHEPSNRNLGRNGVATQPGSRTMSPAVNSRQLTVDDSQLYSRLRQPSQGNAIATNFQIPKTVNDSGGSLSELAAEIACLFWFESADLLKQIEESPIPLQPSRALVADAKPSTGFRKWVTTILSTTQITQAVVLLALLFIHRLKKLNPTVRGKPGSEYRLLTVALMLGNKFLDDNTYTNKTWAEVSGINVNEVHIMEVEFLSNMKYCLYTSTEDWVRWQTLLGKFASFTDRANRPPPPAPILPPASSLHLPMALPSPPASNQASPPYQADLAPYGSSFASQLGPTPAPSPMNFMSNNVGLSQNPRKRSRDEYATEPPAKRVASTYQDYSSPQYYASTQRQPQSSQAARTTLPSLANTVSHAGNGSMLQAPQLQQLPPLNVPARAMALAYPSGNTQAASYQQISPQAGPPSQPRFPMPQQFQSRQHSPYLASATSSPARGLPRPATTPQPNCQVSPTYYLQQRSSPYRPVHNVSTLTYPPTTSALSEQPQNIEVSRMHYQPLAKSNNQAQQGRLPYIGQNIWLNGDQQHSMTPVFQWPGFNMRQYQNAIPQQ